MLLCYLLTIAFKTLDILFEIGNTKYSGSSIQTNVGNFHYEGQKR